MIIFLLTILAKKNNNNNQKTPFFICVLCVSNRYLLLHSKPPQNSRLKHSQSLILFMCLGLTGLNKAVLARDLTQLKLKV